MADDGLAVSASLPYVPYREYNGTLPTGGDPLTEDLNVFYQSGDIAWVVTATALVLLMIPGIGLFYSGLARRRSALSLIWLSLMATGVTSVQWFFWGYSLAFSRSASLFIGNLSNIGLRNVLAQPSLSSARIPELLFAVNQGMFASVTVALTVGAVSERGRMLPCIVFMFVWSTLVYDPIACWTWNPNGWAWKMGSMDFAGGTPVHISSGFAALAYSYILGKRSGYGTQAVNYRPHNVTHVVIGTVFLWVGWFGFNAGSAFSANLRAIMALVNTHLAACVSGITWCVLDFRYEHRWSTVGFCSGVISGLVAITPAAGFVPAWSSLVFGIIAGAGCNLSTQLKFYLGADDALDIFAVHGMGGLIGNVLTAFFAADYIARLDGSTSIRGGWLNGNWAQLGIQLADSLSGAGWSFLVSCLLLVLMKRLGHVIPALRLRASTEEEEAGIDDVEIGEFAYDHTDIVREIKQMESGAGRHDVTGDVEYGEPWEDEVGSSNSMRRHSRAAILEVDAKVVPGLFPMRTFSRERPSRSRNGEEMYQVGIAS